MIYIGFSTHSHKLYARILCKKYKHCAPVIVNKNECIIYQFVNAYKQEKISIKPRDLNILKQHGWTFVKYNCKINPDTKFVALTCVQFTKHLCGIKNIMIQTPDKLFNFLN